MSYINPYYYPEKLDLDMLSFENGGSYEYDTLCFWSPKQSVGLVYSASESGCSCPIPFEGYGGKNQSEVLQSLERVRDISHGLILLDEWGNNFSFRKVELENWLIEKGLKFKGS